MCPAHSQTTRQLQSTHMAIVLTGWGLTSCKLDAPLKPWLLAQQCSHGKQHTCLGVFVVSCACLCCVIKVNNVKT